MQALRRCENAVPGVLVAAMVTYLFYGMVSGPSSLEHQFNAGQGGGGGAGGGAQFYTSKRRRNSDVSKKKRPHIVFVLADDLGQADVGWQPYSFSPDRRGGVGGAGEGGSLAAVKAEKQRREEAFQQLRGALVGAHSMTHSSFPPLATTP